jgi:hypothetical protein
MKHSKLESPGAQLSRYGKQLRRIACSSAAPHSAQKTAKARRFR